METNEKPSKPPDAAANDHEGVIDQLGVTKNYQLGGQQIDDNQEMLSQDELPNLENPTGDQTGENKNSNQDDGTTQIPSHQEKETSNQGDQVMSNGQESVPVDQSDQRVSSTPDKNEANVPSKEPVASSTDQDKSPLSDDSCPERNNEGDSQATGNSQATTDNQATTDSQDTEIIDSQATEDSQATTDSQDTDMIDSQDTDGTNAGTSSDDDYQSVTTDEVNDGDTDSNGGSDDDEKKIPRPWYQFWRSGDPVCFLVL